MSPDEAKAEGIGGTPVEQPYPEGMPPVQPVMTAWQAWALQRKEIG